MTKEKMDQYKNWLEQQKKTKAIIYIREAEVYNLNGTRNWELQEEIITEFCKELGLEVVDSYMDLSKDDNEQLICLMIDTLDYKISYATDDDTVVIMLGVDRISKEVQDILSVATTFRMGGFDLITVNEGWIFEDFEFNAITVEERHDLIQLDWALEDCEVAK